MAKDNAKANTKAYEIYLKGQGIECKELNKKLRKFRTFKS